VFCLPAPKNFALQNSSHRTENFGGARPLKPQVRAKTVGGKRLQCFCENMQIQILRSHFDVKCEHGGVTHVATAKIFAVCDVPFNSTNFEQNGEQNFFFLCLPRVLANHEARTDSF
jgi:hypothetical protein